MTSKRKLLLAGLAVAVLVAVGCKETLIEPDVPDMTAELTVYECQGLPYECNEGPAIERDAVPWDQWVLIRARFEFVERGFFVAEWDMCKQYSNCPVIVRESEGRRVVIIDRPSAFVGPQDITVIAMGVNGDRIVADTLVVEAP